MREAGVHVACERSECSEGVRLREVRGVREVRVHDGCERCRNA